MTKDRNPNDDRSDSKNPTSDSHKAARDNRSNQLNPNNKAFHKSRSSKGKE